MQQLPATAAAVAARRQRRPRRGSWCRHDVVEQRLRAEPHTFFSPLQVDHLLLCGADPLLPNAAGACLPVQAFHMLLPPAACRPLVVAVCCHPITPLPACCPSVRLPCQLKRCPQQRLPALCQPAAGELPLEVVPVCGDRCLGNGKLSCRCMGPRDQVGPLAAVHCQEGGGLLAAGQLSCIGRACCCRRVLSRHSFTAACRAQEAWECRSRLARTLILRRCVVQFRCAPFWSRPPPVGNGMAGMCSAAGMQPAGSCDCTLRCCISDGPLPFWPAAGMGCRPGSAWPCCACCACWACGATTPRCTAPPSMPTWRRAQSSAAGAC